MLRHFLGFVLRLGQDWGPSATARTGLRSGRCGHMTNFINVLSIECMYKIDRREGGGGVQKSFSRKLPIWKLE